MSTTSEPHLACYHMGPEFDWWRCRESGYVGRPPSPFPAPFETPPRVWRPDSSDPRTGTKDLSATAGDDKKDPGENSGCNGPASGGHDGFDGSEEARKLYWPLCSGPEYQEPVQTSDLDDVDISGLGSARKKTPRLIHKRPPWIPAKMPNKWGVAGHPPPYTNYCRETLFDTRKADPSKVVIRTTF